MAAVVNQWVGPAAETVWPGVYTYTVWLRFLAAVFIFCLGVSCYFSSKEPPLTLVALMLFAVVVVGLLLGPHARSASLRKAVSLAVKIAGVCCSCCRSSLRKPTTRKPRQ